MWVSSRDHHFWWAGQNHLLQGHSLPQEARHWQLTNLPPFTCHLDQECGDWGHDQLWPTDSSARPTGPEWRWPAIRLDMPAWARARQPDLPECSQLLLDLHAPRMPRWGLIPQLRDPILLSPANQSIHLKIWPTGHFTKVRDICILQAVRASRGRESLLESKLTREPVP